MCNRDEMICRKSRCVVNIQNTRVAENIERINVACEGSRHLHRDSARIPINVDRHRTLWAETINRQVSSIGLHVNGWVPTYGIVGRLRITAAVEEHWVRSRL